MLGYRGFLCLLFGTSLALIQQRPAGETSENTKENLAVHGSHIAAIGHVPHAHYLHNSFLVYFSIS